MGYTIELVSTALCLVPILTFIAVFMKQCQFYHPSVYTLLVLNMRAAILLPMFSITVCFAVWFPRWFHVIIPIQAVFEGYSILAFYAMLVHNCGGPCSVIRFLSTSADRVICCDCQTQSPLTFYQRTNDAIWQFVPITETLASLVWFLSGNPLLYQGIQIICFSQTIYMLVFFLNIAYTLYEECAGMFVLHKLMVVKISVGLFAIQYIIFDQLFAAGDLRISKAYSFSSYEQQLRVQRAYCLLCLAEFALLSVSLWIGFSPRLVPSSMFQIVGPDSKATTPSSRDSRVEEESAGMSSLSHVDLLDEFSNLEYGRFLLDVCNIWKCPCNELIMVNKDGAAAALSNTGSLYSPLYQTDSINLS